jgi:hypothetical protein
VCKLVLSLQGGTFSMARNPSAQHWLYSSCLLPTTGYTLETGMQMLPFGNQSALASRRQQHVPADTPNSHAVQHSPLADER